MVDFSQEKPENPEIVRKIQMVRKNQEKIRKKYIWSGRKKFLYQEKYFLQ